MVIAAAILGGPVVTADSLQTDHVTIAVFPRKLVIDIRYIKPKTQSAPYKGMVM